MFSPQFIRMILTLTLLMLPGIGLCGDRFESSDQHLTDKKNDRTLADTYAAETANVENQILAITKQLDLLASKPDEIFVPTMARLESEIEALAKQRFDAVTRAKYSNLLYRIGVALTTRATAKDYAGNPATLLDIAISALDKSVSLATKGTPTYADKMLWLARAHSQMGFQAEAAAIYEKIAQMPQSGFPRLWIEYLRLSETTVKDSKSYQTALERALEDSRDRGDNDSYEPVMRHLLGLSYRNTKQYAKSTEVLKVNLDKRGNLLAYDMLLIAWNARDSKDIPGAQAVLEEIVAKYPKTGEGETAQGELRRLIYQPLPPEEATAQKPKRGVLIGANLVAIIALVAVFIGRQVRRKSLQRNHS